LVFDEDGGPEFPDDCPFQDARQSQGSSVQHWLNLSITERPCLIMGIPLSDQVTGHKSAIEIVQRAHANTEIARLATNNALPAERAAHGDTENDKVIIMEENETENKDLEDMISTCVETSSCQGRIA
jgi:hypothetical protein